MIGSVSTHRRALAFAQSLDERELGEDAAAGRTADDGSRGSAPPVPDVAADGEGEGEQASLLAVVEGLGALPRPELDPEVKTTQRARLVAAMEAAFADAGSAAGAAGRLPEQRTGRSGRGAHRAPGVASLGRLRPRSRLGKGLAAGGLSVGVAATAFGGAAAASTDALPGDSLYGFKRGMEDFQLDLADGDADRGRIFLDHASTRLREARRLMERQRAGSLDDESIAEIRRALAGMQHDASEGHRLLSAAYARDGKIGRMQSLSAFAGDHREAWSHLRDRLPAQLTEMGAQVSSVFDAIEDDVEPLRARFPSTPDDPSAGGAGGSDDHGTGERSTPQPSSTRSDGSHGGTADGGSPSPSRSGGQDGLLGDNGLLNPSPAPSGAQQGGDGDDGPKLPEPDITLPPLIPDVLPGLGIDTGDD
ncbi:MAG TPA: DUF5667 domain-containing protein [Streptomyces sp.]|nr:DUF5667 domain-containing protein [Streptomyces sp.]